MARLLLLTAQRCAAPRDEDGEALEDEDEDHRETTTLVVPSLTRLRVCAVLPAETAIIFPPCVDEKRHPAFRPPQQLVPKIIS